MVKFYWLFLGEYGMLGPEFAVNRRIENLKTIIIQKVNERNAHVPLKWDMVDHSFKFSKLLT